jgi:hypothetical protein
MKNLGYAKNKQQLVAYINQDIDKIFERVGEKLLEELQKQIVKDVYGGIPPTYNQQYYGGKYGDENTGFYEPTYEFLDAWNFRTAKNAGNPKITVYFVPSSLDKKAHRSIVGKKDVRKNLADILNNAYKGGDDPTDRGDGYTSDLQVGGGTNGMTGEVIEPTHVSKYRKPYWTRFLKKITSKSGKYSLKQMIKEEAKRQGLQLR